MNTPLFNGIDVSQYQGIIGWEQVAKSNIDFAIIRLGYAGYDGMITLDSFFQRNAEEAMKSQIPIGVYVYSYCRTKEAARLAASQTLSFIKPYQLKYPVIFDIENSLYQKYDKFANSILAAAYLNLIEKGQYYAMLYTYTDFANTYLEMDMLKKFDVWIADYHNPITYQGDYGIWQYSNQGAVNGISVPVDLDYSYRNYPEIISEAKLNPYIPPQKKWAVHVFSFENQLTAIALRNALKLLDINSEVKLISVNKYMVSISDLPSFERASEIQDALKLLKNYYSEIIAE